MSKPQPASYAPEELIRLALEVVASDRFPHLATIDGDQPRLRPVSPVKTEGFHVHVANLKPYHKTVEIAANPRVELCYLSDGHDQVRITGVAEVESDRVVLQAIWDSSPLSENTSARSTDSELVVYLIRPERVRYMEEWAARLPRGSVHA